MALRLEDRWAWDFWLADDGERFHAFYLQAPRSLGDPHLRHWNVSIGHAVSTDLVDWEVLPDALAPGPPAAWDDAATWTGCVVRHAGTWWMFYTGASSVDDALVQRIGAATSADLVTWERHPANPLLEADPRWYEKLDLDAWHDEAWRDPWVVRHDGSWHMLITARRRDGDPDERGVIGHARSADLVTWEVGPPVSRPGGFGHLEVPQSATVDGAPLLLFSVDPAHVSDSRLATVSAGLEAGTYIALGDSEIGPFDVAGARLLPHPGLYSCRFVRRRDGSQVLLGFVNEVDGRFAGEISDPLPFDAAAARVSRFGALEAGGTKFVCLVGSGPGDIAAAGRFPTTTPGATLGKAVAFFREHGPVDAVGVASFGPVELRPGHHAYGHITATPKPGWQDVDVVGPLRDELGVPIGFDTDVNGAALGEGRWGAAAGIDDFVYLTVGTGIGAGVVAGGRLVHGLVHPEVGHVAVPRQAGDDFPGACPYHGDCLEGMASGPAIASRWGRRAEELEGAELEQAVQLEAGYLGAGIRNLVYALAPGRVVLGGGVSALPGLVPGLRVALQTELAGYPGLPEHHADGFVVQSTLSGEAGAFGALILAEQALGS